MASLGTDSWRQLNCPHQCLVFQIIKESLQSHSSPRRRFWKHLPGYGTHYFLPHFGSNRTHPYIALISTTVQTFTTIPHACTLIRKVYFCWVGCCLQLFGGQNGVQWQLCSNLCPKMCPESEWGLRPRTNVCVSPPYPPSTHGQLMFPCFFVFFFISGPFALNLWSSLPLWDTAFFTIPLLISTVSMFHIMPP